MIAAVILLLVLSWGGTRLPWLSPTILAMIGASLVFAVDFVWHAMRTREPFLPLPLMGGSVVPWAMAAGGCAVGAMLGLTVHMPIYYEAVYRLSASEAGLALIPLVAVSVPGAWLMGRAMVRLKHYKRVAIAGTLLAATMALAIAALTPMPLWALLTGLSLFAFGLGTTFPVSVVSIQNAVARAQVGTATGAMNFFRALMAAFMVAAFTTILMMALGGNVAVVGGHDGAHLAGASSRSEMVAAFRYVFAAAGILMAGAALCLVMMEERPLAGPAIVAAGEAVD
jgi:MFS family permease